MREEQELLKGFSAKKGFIDAFTDFAFKHLFGREANKDLLIHFLNGIFNGRKKIIDLDYGNVELKGPGKDYRKTIFDLYCTGIDGEKFIVEMQKSNPDNFKDRSIFYTSALIQEQGVAVDAGWDYLLPEVFFIAIMNFKFEDSNPDHYFHDVRLMEINTNTEFYPKLNYIFIEMPKFRKAESALKSDQDYWFFMLKNLYQFKEIPLSLSSKEEFIKLFDVAALGNLNPQEMDAYQQSLKVQRDNNSVRRAAVKEGLEEGLKEGLKEGLEKGRLEMSQEIIENLILELSLTDSQISKLAKVSVDCVKKIRLELSERK
ncbi:putative transposase/invertase (TIGR01784 family) [Pedobacter sp. UYP24]